MMVMIKMTGEATEVRSGKEKQHQSVSISIRQHQSVSISLNQNQYASIRMAEVPKVPKVIEVAEV